MRDDDDDKLAHMNPRERANVKAKQGAVERQKAVRAAENAKRKAQAALSNKGRMPFDARRLQTDAAARQAAERAATFDRHNGNPREIENDLAKAAAAAKARRV